MQIAFSRKQAFKLAWNLFWMATGTSRVGLKYDLDTKTIELVGKNWIN